MEYFRKSRLQVLWAIQRVFLAVLLVVSVSASMNCGGKAVRSRGPTPPPSRPEMPGARVDEIEPEATGEIVATALSQVGRAYRWGGNTPERGFDCSGFVQWVYAQHGVDLPRTAAEQIRNGRPVTQSDIRPGDLLFYAMRNRQRQADHVGIYTGKGRLAHSPRTGRRISLSRAFDRYYGPRFLGARRFVSGAPAAQVFDLPEERRNVGRLDRSSGRSYTVREGDYIWKIARRFGVSPWKILEINDLELSDVLKVGQRLLIPEP